MLKIKSIAVLLSALLLSACDDTHPDPRQQQDIRSIKQLIYPYDPTVTLGGILDNRPDCIDPKWETFVDNKGRQLVKYRCNYNVATNRDDINQWVDNRYETVQKNHTQLLNEITSWKRRGIHTDADANIARIEKELGMINALSNIDWSALKDDTCTDINEYGCRIYLYFGKLSSSQESTLTVEQKALIEKWNVITETLSYGEGFNINEWFSAETPSNVIAPLVKELAEQKEIQAQEYQKGDNRRREDKIALNHALEELKAAQAEAKNWQITQELYWSVTGAEPIFMGGLFLVNDHHGQSELIPYSPISNSPYLRGLNILEDIYKDKINTDYYKDMLAFGLYVHQVKSIKFPLIEKHLY
ncbi:hypothetical protein [Proteus terrae]|uniref:hypothetical protein n=1 Tax=Proteus terrae TaxID=1574161 RepID=UPI000D68F97D|nr:hypothetical protein [Proteus terrae]